MRIPEMRVAFFTILIAVGSLNAQPPRSMLMHCDNSENLSAEVKLSKIRSFSDIQDTKTLECIFSYMDHLSMVRDVRAPPLIANYLDVPNPKLQEKQTNAPNPGHGVPLGGHYPALIYLMMYRQDALPVLLKTISAEPEFTLKAENAVRAWMYIEAPNPPMGVQLLAEAAREANGTSAKTLSEAARFATTTWQCHLLLTDCQNALSTTGQISHQGAP